MTPGCPLQVATDALDGNPFLWHRHGPWCSPGGLTAALRATEAVLSALGIPGCGTCWACVRIKTVHRDLDLYVGDER